jgi:hypothetical protein
VVAFHELLKLNCSQSLLKMKNILSLNLLILYSCAMFSQVGVGTTNPDPSTVFHIESNSKGMLLPRLTTVEQNNIVNPATGLIIYNIDENEFRFNFGTPASPNWIKSSRNQAVKYSNNNADTSVNVNANSKINAPIVSTLEWNDDPSIYSVDTGNNTITVDKPGRYRIVVNISLITTTNTARLTPEMWIEINGTQRGSYSSTGYVRNANGQKESSLHLSEVFELNTNDIISVGIVRTANAGSVNLRSIGSSNIYIEKI